MCLKHLLPVADTAQTRESLIELAQHIADLDRELADLEKQRDRAVAAIHERLAEPRKPVVPLTNGERRSNA